MAIKLVPDVEPDTMTEDQARAYLIALRTPKLDAFRVRVKTMKTSELIGCYANVEHVAVSVCDFPDKPSDADQEALMAGLLAVTEEIDRRLPIP